jgi:hypothetical protein
MPKEARAGKALTTVVTILCHRGKELYTKKINMKKGRFPGPSDLKGGPEN